jgi:xanthine phosphoribosyltransferase
MNYIKDNAVFLDGNIIKVDTFVNQQVDPSFMDEVANEFYKVFKESQIDRIVTIESGGIAPSLLTALKLNVPLTVIKKETSVLMDNIYKASVYSYTKKKTYELCVNKHNLKANERVLFIDDFLANGNAFLATKEIVEQSGSNVVGVGILIEKSFQGGVTKISDLNIKYHAIAKANKNNNQLYWMED